MSHVISWFEIPVINMDRAIKFYEGLSGSKVNRVDFGLPDEQMAVFETVDQQADISGALVACPRAAPGSKGPMIFLNASPKIDTWLGRAVNCGGKVVVPKTEIPGGMGFFAHVEDTEGNHVGLHAME